MSSIRSEDFSKYSAFDETVSSTIADSTTFVVQSKTATASLSLADVKFDNENVEGRKHLQEYSRDEFLYALSSPSSIGALAWILSSFIAVIHGSSIVVYLNFCIPLLVGPYVIKEQISAQLLPSVRKKIKKLRNEVNELAIKNVQLKGTVSRMQRQEYRLSAAEERFEHLCQRSEKDIVKMKQLARKNSALREKIRANLAGKKLQELLSDVLTNDLNGSYFITEKQIHQVVLLMKNFAGKNASLKFDKGAIHRAVINSITKNMKITLVSNIESDTETLSFEGDSDQQKKYKTKEPSRLYRNEEETEEESSNLDNITKPSQQSHEGRSDVDSREDGSWTASNNNIKCKSLKSDPSGHLHETRYNKEASRAVMQTNLASGTADKPIDIEKLLFDNNTQKGQKEMVGSRYRHSE